MSERTTLEMLSVTAIWIVTMLFPPLVTIFLTVTYGLPWGWSAIAGVIAAVGEYGVYRSWERGEII